MQIKLNDMAFGYTSDQLIIKKSVIKTFKKFIIGEKKNESGGILLGNVFNSHCYIVKVTTPNKYDSFGPNYFVRSKQGAQSYINKSWKKSNGSEIYLGEWHTHFEELPLPSNIDKEMILNSLKKTKMEIDFLFLIIIGLNNIFWIGKQTKEILIELKKERKNKSLTK